MEEHTIILLGRTSNKKHVDQLLSSIMEKANYYITKLEYNKAFKNWLIWRYIDKK